MNDGHLSLLLGFLLSLTVCYFCLEEEENVAVGMKAVQSSTAYNGYPSRAVDGRRDSNYRQGSCSHTARHWRPWWRVHLRYPHNISSVAVTNRGDCCYQGIHGVEIRIGNSRSWSCCNAAWPNVYDTSDDCYHDVILKNFLVQFGMNHSSNYCVYMYTVFRCAQIVSIPAGATITYQCHGMIGRYVSLTVNRTDYLQVCEVEVYGRVVHEVVCTSPKKLTQPWRNIAYNYTNTRQFPKCDELAGTWVRFSGITGDVMPESCVGSCCSGSRYSTYLGFTHPQLGEGVKKGIIHLRSLNNCSTGSIDGMRVLACPGGHYVYRMPPLSCPAVFSARHSKCSAGSCGTHMACTSDGGCVCIPGYRIPVGRLPTVGSICDEIDECAEDPNVCGPNAVCTNTPGNHNCTCHSGYGVIKSGSKASTSNPCEDVDECIELPCGPGAVCDNTPGSYYCSCLDGYISSSGLTWEAGVTVCKSSQEFLASLNPPEGQTREMFFLSTIEKDLDDNPDIVLSEKTVTAVLSTTMSVTDNISPEEEKDGQAETANVVLKISEGLVSALVEPESQENNTEAWKIVKTPHMEINLVSLKGNMTGMPELVAKGNMMEINLAAVAKNNNGSASAALMSVSGVEKFMSPSFFESENVTEIYSDIITATLPKTRNMELPEPVNFTMSNRKTFQAGMVTCVYWEERGRETHWSVEGCTASFSNETHTVCSCTHLSTFAVLLQMEKQEEDDTLLEMVNLFCMCVGLTFLALAILTFLLCTWNPKVNNTARLHLSICLFLGHLLFLVGESRTENAVVCAVIAGTLHFLFLSSFVWMFLETLQLFLLVRSLAKVAVIQKEGVKALYLLLIGYGTPMVVVGVSAAVFSDGYGSKDVCWLSQEKFFHWSFLGPVAAILTLNLVSFCVILWILQPTLANMKSDISQSRDTRLIIFKIVAQFFVLGCAWILGFFQSSTMLKYLFIILNSQQGTFIFIVHCLLNKEVREEYKRWFSCLFRAKEPSGSKGSPNTVSTVQK